MRTILRVAAKASLAWRRQKGENMRKLVVTVVLVAAGVAAPSAFAVDRPGNTDQAMAIVDSHVGDVPAPNGQGIVNNIDNLPVAAFNSTTRNPICGAFTGTGP